MSATIRIKRVLADVDMRAYRVLRSKAIMYLTPREGWLLFNKANTIARLLDSQGGVHTYYSPKGEVFDTTLLEGMVGKGLAITLSGHTTSSTKAPRTWQRAA